VLFDQSGDVEVDHGRLSPVLEAAGLVAADGAVDELADKVDLPGSGPAGELASGEWPSPVGLVRLP
jgi:hypothetical protein